jgi:RNA polymerase sigma-70 factor (ECF subfamily)
LNLNAGVSAYLFRAVQNLSLNFVEHRKVVNSYYAVIAKVYEDSSEDLSVDSQIRYAELNQKIEKAITALPAECRRIFRMSREEGLKYTEIAAQLGISVKTVETQMSRALLKLKTELKDFLTILLINFL